MLGRHLLKAVTTCTANVRVNIRLSFSRHEGVWTNEGTAAIIISSEQMEASGQLQAPIRLNPEEIVPVTLLTRG